MRSTALPLFHKTRNNERLRATLHREKDKNHL
jgi:hypothetical protein